MLSWSTAKPPGIWTYILLFEPPSSCSSFLPFFLLVWFLLPLPRSFCWLPQVSLPVVHGFPTDFRSASSLVCKDIAVLLRHTWAPLRGPTPFYIISYFTAFYHIILCYPPQSGRGRESACFEASPLCTSARERNPFRQSSPSHSPVYFGWLWICV